MAEYKKPKQTPTRKQAPKQPKKQAPKKQAQKKMPPPETPAQKKARLEKARMAQDAAYRKRNEREELRIKAREREKEMLRMEMAEEARDVTFYDFEGSEKAIFGELGPPRGTLRIDKYGRYHDVKPKK